MRKRLTCSSAKFGGALRPPLKVATALTFRERSISSYFLAWGKSKRFAKAESERKCEPPTFGATCSMFNHSTMARVDLLVSLLDQHVISSVEADTCPFEKRLHVRERERNCDDRSVCRM